MADSSYGEKEADMSVALAVGLGGAAGALSRYGLDTFIERRSESVFPWATFVINVSGCLAVGFLIAALVDRHHAPQWLRTGLVVGFCGGYTTFSTFGQETLDLVEARDVTIAVLNVTASVVLGVLAVLAGNRLGRLVG
jgi:fluoride exporter